MYEHTLRKIKYPITNNPNYSSVNIRKYEQYSIINRIVHNIKNSLYTVLFLKKNTLSLTRTATKRTGNELLNISWRSKDVNYIIHVKEDGVVSARSETSVEGLTWKSEGEGKRMIRARQDMLDGGVAYYVVNTVHIGILAAGGKITITV